MGLKLEGEGKTLEELKLEKVCEGGGREALDYPGLNLQWKRKMKKDLSVLDVSNTFDLN